MFQTVKWTRIGVRFPARSSSSPLRVCGPAAKACVKVTVLPESAPATAPPSMSEAKTSARSSFAVTATEPATVAIEPSDGAEEESVGAVLSTRRSSTDAEVVTLPASSVTRTRRS